MSAASAISRLPVERQSPRSSSRSIASESVADKIRVGGSASIRVVARSMYPWLRPGDQVFVRRYDFAQIVPGDVVLYQRANRLFIHRVVQKISRPNLEGKADFLVTKADAAHRPSAPVSAKEFLGRAIRIHRGRRHIDLESFSMKILGKALARISRATRWVYRPSPKSQLTAVE